MKRVAALLITVGLFSTIYAANEAEKVANIKKSTAEAIKAADDVKKTADDVKKSIDENRSMEEIITAVDEMKKAADNAKKAADSVGSAVDDEKKVSTHAELSYANTGGNTESQDVAGNLKLNVPFYSNEIRFVGNVLYSDNDNFDVNGSYIDTTTTKNRWDAELNYDYNFNDTVAFNYIAGAKGDKFSTFVYQAYTGPGAVLTVVKNDAHDLKFQANLLYLWDEHRAAFDADANATIPQHVHHYAGYQISMDYTFQITEITKFTQYLMYRSEFEDTTNYFGKSKTAVESKMSDIFSLGVSYTIDYTNNKAETVPSHVDSVFLASLIADF